MRQGAKIYSARALRKSETLAEKRLWEQLRNRTLEGFKFSRQVPIGPYIADFVCREQRMIVEADGPRIRQLKRMPMTIAGLNS
jgi:very-short-patch-repair endonuclease